MRKIPSGLQQWEQQDRDSFAAIKVPNAVWRLTAQQKAISGFCEAGRQKCAAQSEAGNNLTQESTWHRVWHHVCRTWHRVRSWWKWGSSTKSGLNKTFYYKLIWGTAGELDAPPFLVRNSQISSAKGLFIIITRRSRHAFATFAGAPCAQMVVTKETTEIVM